MRPVPADLDLGGASGPLLPVSIVTGFLGSGKTTLIRRILRDEAFSRTAIIVNEFGEVGLDHELIASSDDSILTLNTGCLCCAVQTDLARTLMKLRERNTDRATAYDRVLIETSGLSDPTTMLQAMLSDAAVFNSHQVPVVITIVDTLHGEPTLRQHAEARHQVALADRLLFTKTDLQAPSDGLQIQLEELNSAAPRMTASEVHPSMMFQSTSTAELLGRLAGIPRGQAHKEVRTFTIVRTRPLPALALTMFLQAVAEHCGSHLLRLKGIVAIEEVAERPAVIHGIRHVFTPPEFLDHWPSADKTTRIVFIVKNIPEHFFVRLLDAIEEEVREVSELASSKL